MQPRNSALYNPASDAQTTSVLGVPFSNNRGDAETTQCATMRFRIVASIPLYGVRFPTRSASLATHRRDGVNERNQLCDIMGIRRCQDHRERHTLCIRDEMMFAAALSSIGGIGANLRPPKTALTEPLSTTALDQSIWSASLSLASNTSRILSQAPASCQTRRYRQQLMPEPQPISCGNISHGMPLLSTKIIPVNALRRSIGLRPGCLYRRVFGGGSKGSTISQSSSETSSFAIKGFSLSIPLYNFLASVTNVSHFVRGSKYSTS